VAFAMDGMDSLMGWNRVAGLRILASPPRWARTKGGLDTRAGTV